MQLILIKTRKPWLEGEKSGVLKKSLSHLHVYTGLALKEHSSIHSSKILGTLCDTAQYTQKQFQRNSKEGAAVSANQAWGQIH